VRVSNLIIICETLKAREPQNKHERNMNNQTTIRKQINPGGATLLFASSTPTAAQHGIFIQKQRFIEIITIKLGAHEQTFY
jgi:hypothetical protein